MYKTRRATKSDLLYLLDIDVKCYDPCWNRETWEQALETHIVFTTTWWGKPVGLGVLRTFPQVGHIVRCAVKDRHRRKGLGTNLIVACMNRARTHGCRTISCVVPEPLIYPDTGGLGAFLNQAGLRADGIIPAHIQLDGETVDAVRFLKRLACPE